MLNILNMQKKIWYIASDMQKLSYLCTAIKMGEIVNEK